MDVTTVLIGVAVFVISALMIYCISAFSMREKTFEEVMEEQRRRQEEEREKAKAEKKAEKEQQKRKYGKRGKQEKPKEKVSTVVESVEHKMVNLELEPEIIEPTESLGLSTAVRHRVKKEKATKSILHNRDEVAPVAVKTVDVRHKAVAPKDEFEMKKSHEKIVVERVEKVKVVHTESSVKERNKHSQEIKENLPPKKGDEETSTKQSTDEGDKRSSKSRSSDDAPLNGARLITSVKTAKLSDNHVQTLIEILLNRQGLGSGVSELPTESWNKKSQKGDPVLLLKKQLEEKERALQEEQTLAMTANARVKELRNELGTERTKYGGVEKQYQEKVAQQQSELEALRQRINHSHEQHLRETSILQAQVRQLEQGGDRAAVIKLTEENKILQETLSLKSQEAVKLSESAKNYEKQLTTSVSKIQTIEVDRKSAEAKTKSCEEQMCNLEVAQKNVDILNTKRTEEIGSELIKSEAKNASLRSDLEKGTAALSTAQGEVSTLMCKLQELEAHPSHADASKGTESKLQESERKCSDLEGNMKNLSKQLNDISQRLKERETELQRLQQENRSLADENKIFSEKLQNAPASNGDMHQENGSFLSIEEHERIVSDKSAELCEMTTNLESQKKVTASLQIQVDTRAAEVEDLKMQLAHQKTKNNELREKNWKAMEALNEAEKNSSEKALKSARELRNSGVAETEKFDKAVFLRLFPDVQVSGKLAHKEWISTFEKQAIKKLSSNSDTEKLVKLQQENKVLRADLDVSKNNLNEVSAKVNRLAQVEQEYTQLKKSSNSSKLDSEKYSQLESENIRFKAEVDNYRSIVSETESKVCELEKSIDAEEKKWQEKLKQTQSTLSDASSERIAQLEGFVKEQDNQMQEYRHVLAQTELSLKEVENKVASQEKTWQGKLASSQSELDKTRTELTSLKQELLDSRGSKEMQVKIENLEKELKVSQNAFIILTREKETVCTRIIELESKVSSVDTVQMEKGVSDLRTQLESERKKTKDLSLNVVKLNGIIKTGQDALSQEQGLIKKLQDQLDSKSVSLGETELEEVDQTTLSSDIAGTSV